MTKFILHKRSAHRVHTPVMVQAITGQGGGWLLWTEKCGYENRGIDVQGGVPPLVREVDCFAGPNSALEQLHLRV